MRFITCSTIKLSIGVVIIAFLYPGSAGHAFASGNSSLTQAEPLFGAPLEILGRLAIICFIALFSAVLLVFFRVIGNFPSELDRIGSDISLFGFGMSIFLLLQAAQGRPILPRIGSPELSLVFAATSLVVTLLAYVSNLYFSWRIRQLNLSDYAQGLETIEHLRRVMEDPRGRRLMTASLMFALFPTILISLAATVSW
jgi:hypothetical protein